MEMTPASLDELLKEWEAEAKESEMEYIRIAVAGPKPSSQLDQERILSLIAVVRKQREALEFYSNQDSYEWDGKIIDDGGKRLGYGKKAREAIAEAERILKS